jgi:hypothetical protein
MQLDTRNNLDAPPRQDDRLVLSGCARCDACRFWNKNGEPWERRGTEAEDFEPQPTRKKKCLRVLHANCSDRADFAPDVLAIVTDGSGYAATFWTDPQFACVMFEAGEPPADAEA